MALRHPYLLSAGFTLVETLLVIGLFMIIFSVGLFMGLDTYRGYSRRSERDILVSVLERARSRAMANIDQHAWGVCYDDSAPSAPQYVIFSGNAYGTAFDKESVPGNPGAILDNAAAPALPCASGGIVFSQLTGDASAVSSIAITEGSMTSSVAVNSLGRIDW